MNRSVLCHCTVGKVETRDRLECLLVKLLIPSLIEVFYWCNLAVGHRQVYNNQRATVDEPGRATDCDSNAVWAILR